MIKKGIILPEIEEVHVNEIEEIEDLIRRIESLAPVRTEHIRVINRPVGTEQIIDDSIAPETAFSDEEIDEEPFLEEIPLVDVSNFGIFNCCPLVAVDCGIVRLGETENGLVIALRAAIVIEDNANSRIRLFRTGPIYLHNRYKPQILHQLGIHLGKPNFFVELDNTDPDNPRPISVKKGVADNAHQYGDRFRSWFERLIQKIAVTSIENGIIIFDGALTLRTRDIPSAYLKGLASAANRNRNSIIGISKQSMLQIQGRPIPFWLNDRPNQACYRNLTRLLRQEGERAERVLGNLYAARFSSLGPTLRMDVKAAQIRSDSEAINQLFCSSLMRGGYPDILVRAHAYSYFTTPSVIQLQAQAAVNYRLVPQKEVDLTGIFGPFGGRFK